MYACLENRKVLVLHNFFSVGDAKEISVCLFSPYFFLNTHSYIHQLINLLLDIYYSTAHETPIPAMSLLCSRVNAGLPLLLASWSPSLPSALGTSCPCPQIPFFFFLWVGAPASIKYMSTLHFPFNYLAICGSVEAVRHIGFPRISKHNYPSHKSRQIIKYT